GKISEGGGEGGMEEDGLAPPQAQDLPDDRADVVHIHLLDDAPRLDLLFKSIAQSIKFIRRFGDQQRRLRQKCQLVFSTHLLTPVNLPEAGGVGWRQPSWCTNESLRRALLIHAVNHRGRNPVDPMGRPETYLCRSQANGAARLRNRCRIGGGGWRIASRVQIVCAAWRHRLAS